MTVLHYLALLLPVPLRGVLAMNYGVFQMPHQADYELAGFVAGGYLCAPALARLAMPYVIFRLAECYRLEALVGFDRSARGPARLGAVTVPTQAP